MKYQVARLEGEIKVIQHIEGHSNMPICTIPSFYTNDQEIANGIVEALNKSNIKLEIEL